MNEWRLYKVSELCSDIIDCVNKTAPISELPTPYKMLRTSDIRNGFINTDNLNSVTSETFEKWTRRGKLQRGDIVFTREAPLGEAAIVREAENYFLGQRLVLYRANPSVCDNRFLLYAFLTHETKQSIIARGNGATVLHLRVPECGNIEIKAPDIKIQKRIGDILSDYDDLIENNQKQIKLLEEAAQRLYKEWFVDLRFPGHENTPIVDGVPEEWRVSTVGDCSCILRRGISPQYNAEGSSIVINQKCIRQSVVDLKEARRQDKPFAAEMNLIDSDTVICSTGSGTLGRVGQVFGRQINTTFDSHVTLVRASEVIGKQYLYQFLKSKQRYLQEMGKGSTNQLELNRATIQELLLRIPSVAIRDAFEWEVQPIHDQITALARQVLLLQEARDNLLPKLMSGEIEV